MNLIYKYICFGLVLGIKSVLNSPPSRINYDVDEFCDKLLSSDKFEQLVEKVADKAAEKITEMSQHGVSEDSKKSNRAEKKDDDDENENEPKKEKSNEESIESKKNINIASKMALLKKYSIPPLSDLTLQYKNFIKSTPAINITKSKEEDDSATNNRKDEDDSATNTKKTKDAKDTRTLSDERYDDFEKSKSKVTFKDGITFERDESKSESQDDDETSEKNKDKRTPRAKVASDEKFASKENLTATNNKGTVNKYTKEESSQENAVIKSQETIVGANVVKKNKKDRNKRDKDEHYGGPLENDFLVETYNRSELTAEEKIKPVIKKAEPLLRREGDKVYTYQVSSEYDEYHEQLRKAKSQKTKKFKSKSKSERKSFHDASF